MVTRIRPASRDDLPVVLELLRQLHPEDPEVPLAVAQRLWDDIVDQRGRVVLLSEEASGRVVGMVDVTVVVNLTRAARPFVLVENVVVDRSMRRQGIGRALLARAIELGREVGAYKVQLASGSSDATLFYQALGLSTAGPTMKYSLDWPSEAEGR